MKNLLLILIFLSSFAFSQTDCTSANIGVYDAKGALVSSHTQTYKANTAAILLAQQQGKATVKTPDIVCTEKISSSAQSSISQSSATSSSKSMVSSAASSGTNSNSVLFYDGFESGSLSMKNNGVFWGSSAYTKVSSEQAKNGIYSLKFTYLAETSFSEQRFSLGVPRKEVWISYDVKIPDNYYHRTGSDSSNNKGFLMLWSGNYNTPSGPMIGTEFWPESDGSSTSSIRVYGVGYDKHLWRSCPGIIAISDRGKWIKITIHAKYATAANKDGVFQLWKEYEDGTIQQPCNITNGDWYAAAATGFDQGYLFGWANSKFSNETVFYVDNFMVW